MNRSVFRFTPALLALAVAGSAQAAVEVYGFVQLDYVQDFKRVDPAWDDTLRPSKIPTTEGEYGSDGQAVLSVRQSRLGVKAEIPVEGSSTPITTKFEFDLFGVGVDAGQTTIRPRHIYGSWGQWLAGQTNTLFMDGDIFPNTIDYWGPSGMVFLRSPQIRWTPVSGGDTTIAVAIEKPGNDVDTGTLGKIDPALAGVQGDEKIPDITAQFRKTADWGHVQLAGILRKVGYDTPGAPGNNPSGSELGWGLNATSNIKFGKDTLHLGVVYGEGIASYMNDGGMDLAPDGTGISPEAKSVPLLGVTAYYDHAWADKWTSSIGYSFTEVDNTSLQATDAFNKGEYASLNILHTPAANVLVGAELLWGQRTDNNGADGDDLRLQTTVKYSF